MGSPVSIVVLGICMEDMEEEAMDTVLQVEMLQ